MRLLMPCVVHFGSILNIVVEICWSAFCCEAAACQQFQLDSSWADTSRVGRPWPVAVVVEPASERDLVCCMGYTGTVWYSDIIHYLQILNRPWWTTESLLQYFVHVCNKLPCGMHHGLVTGSPSRKNQFSHIPSSHGWAGGQSSSAGNYIYI